MVSESQSQELLAFFKALSDPNRLKIMGLLAQESYTVEELAALLDLRPSTVSHHLAKLSEAGLVSASAEGHYHNYSIETKALEEKAERLLSEDAMQAVVADIDLDAYDRQVLAHYLEPDGRLKQIPTQRKKLQAVLRYLLQAFQPGVTYGEKEVNELLGNYHPDTAGLRRDLVDAGLLLRDRRGTSYQLAE